MKRDIVLAGPCRTAIGKFGGALADVPVSDLGSIVIQAALKRAGLSLSAVDEVIMGCVLQAGCGQNVARQAAIKAGLPVEIPALTLNNVCGSGLKAVNMAAAMIAAGDAEIVVAGGMENMSAAPYALSKARFGYRMNDGKIIDTMINDGLWEVFNNYHMGQTAENVAEKYGITRQMQDEFAANSQNKCEAARIAGHFDREIVPVPVRIKKQTEEFKIDEYPRDSVTAAALAGLKPAFKPGGTVTAANSSGINDGAAAVVVMSAAKAEELGVKPMARLVSYASRGLEPEIMGMGPVYATQKALAKANLTINDMDIIEANEAFAAQALAVGQLLGLAPDKINVNGGAIALGHPIGASGCRILVTLLYELERRHSRYGLATLCVGGGMGVSTIIENYI